MISLELWRARIGGWGRRIRSSSVPVSSSRVEDGCLDLMTGISIYLLTIIIAIMLVIGGVELNPGPISGDESSIDLDVGNFLFADKEQVSKPFTAVPEMSIAVPEMSIPIRIRRKSYGSKKRRKVFCCEKRAPALDPSPNSSQISNVVEALDNVGLESKIPKLDESSPEISEEIFEFALKTTAQKKISLGKKQSNIHLENE